mgnify:CR=1 FL=1
MKHIIIIIISLIALSSPVIGNDLKGGTLFGWDNPFGDGYIWKGFGDKKNHLKYRGEVKNGKPNGFGILIYKDGRKYEGNWKNGIWFGKGKYSFNDGSGYNGEWKNGVESGLGILTYPNGDKYEG